MVFTRQLHGRPEKQRCKSAETLRLALPTNFESSTKHTEFTTMTFFEKKLFAATIGSAAIVVFSVAFVPSRLKNRIGDAIESISRAGIHIQVSISLDNRNWEGEPPNTSPILLNEESGDAETATDSDSLSESEGTDTATDSESLSESEDTETSNDSETFDESGGAEIPADSASFDESGGTEIPTDSETWYFTSESEDIIDVGILAAAQSTPKQKRTIPLPEDADMGDLVRKAIYSYYLITNECQSFPDDVPSPYGKMEEWDVSSVTSFANLFSGACICFTGMGDNWKFISPIINQWDTSSVISMASAFMSCRFGNDAPDLSAWDVSNVEDMWSVFAGSDFNQPLDSWKPRSATILSEMFFGNKYFNQDLSSWAMDLPQNAYIESMFADTRDFDQCLLSWAPKHPQKDQTFYYAAGCTNKSDNGWCSCTDETVQDIGLS